MQTNKLFEQLIAKQSLTSPQMEKFMHACMRGQLSDIQIASFLVLMRAKGETVEELTTAASVMMQYAKKINLGDTLIDIVGTGGDGKNTFNISTVSCFVAAAAGARIAKHGGRSVSSRSGSADLLLQAGLNINLSDTQLKHCLDECGIAFLFAPHFHQAMQHARNARQELAIRTFFNFLGPLVNPARVKKQVVGVFARQWQKPLAEVLANLGSERAIVVSSRDGLDEVSIAEMTDVVEYHNGQLYHWVIDPKDYNCFHPGLNKIIVDSPTESLHLIQMVLNGELGPARDIVILNTACALLCAGIAKTYEEGIIQAKQAIDSGEAAQRFRRLKELSQQSEKND